ncbi:MAG TPA: anthranilate synthase component I family protein, partial [bacterium]|nr:anthranilate synthase component I family protein [bacterium]
GRIPTFVAGEVLAGTTRSEYQAAFDSIRRALSQGDYYELNYTLEFSSPCQGLSWPLYLALREKMKAPMMAYIDFSDLVICSASPERFFRTCGDVISAFPVKGTSPRGQTQEEDRQNLLRLENSEKDRAELLMITDLLRNDLGRVCRVGSVRVETLVQLQTFSHYHHLVSEISGTLLPESSLLDVFSALFPCGSITGAPKIKVMQHTDTLEGRARGVYTGAIGMISNNGDTDFNIPIRTIVRNKNEIHFATGGGIVADSACDSEYQECLTKASGLLETLAVFGSTAPAFAHQK